MTFFKKERKLALCMYVFKKTKNELHHLPNLIFISCISVILAKQNLKTISLYFDEKSWYKKNTKIPSFFVNTFLHFLPSQSEVNAANRTSETIMKNIGAEKKVQDSKVLKKLSGDEAVQVCMYDVM